ncbi:MAG: bifunctional 5,10-methylenetetrahydrofolate dehydrogenase/5,10-methenyltetrahydrofolate cyclohydrolase [Bdellovibrionales bacterium]
MAEQFLLLNGKEVADSMKATLRQRVEAFFKIHQRKPELHVILVGQDPASQIYVSHKEKACQEVGILSEVWRFSENVQFLDLKNHVEKLVDNPNVDGILVQMPLPQHVDAQALLSLIPKSKDVDGFSEAAMGSLVLNRPQAVACTPAGVMEILKYYKISIEGINAVVIGRSQIVGRPMALLLINAGATVTVCHSKTVNLANHLKQADLVVVAAGQPQFLKTSDFKKGAIVIDVGIHRNSQGKVIGDVDLSGKETHLKAATPVPGGVGPMTIALLLQNTIKLAEFRQEKK